MNSVDAGGIESSPGETAGFDVAPPAPEFVKFFENIQLESDPAYGHVRQASTRTPPRSRSTTASMSRLGTEVEIGHTTVARAARRPSPRRAEGQRRTSSPSRRSGASRRSTSSATPVPPGDRQHHRAGARNRLPRHGDQRQPPVLLCREHPRESRRRPRHVRACSTSTASPPVSRRRRRCQRRGPAGFPSPKARTPRTWTTIDTSAVEHYAFQHGRLHDDTWPPPRRPSRRRSTVPRRRPHSR